MIVTGFLHAGLRVWAVAFWFSAWRFDEVVEQAVADCYYWLVVVREAAEARCKLVAISSQWAWPIHVGPAWP
ncbi:MAG: hypothetical protein ACI814_004255, partial [Mariniblastus sp.]